MFQQVVVVMDAQPGPKAIRRIEEYARQNKCLCGCGRPMWRRGLSRVCYYDWENDLAQLPDEAARATYNAKLIRTGRLLVQWWIRKFKRREQRKTSA